jgi:hypothetical protein
MSQVVSFTGYTPAARFDAIPWTQVQVEEGPTSSGPWTLIDTLTLDPVDADPTDPQSRDLTTVNASDTAGLWYRLIFVDDNSDASQPSTPIQNAEGAATQFATANDLAVRLGITLTTDEITRADALLALASGLIQQETNQTIELVEDDEWVVRSSYAERIRLPQRPVVEVTSVSLTPEGGVPTVIGADTYYVDGDDLVRASFPIKYQQFFADWTRGWLGPLWTLTVVYSHGYETIPEFVKTVCMEMVTRVWVNPGSVARESVGNVSTVYDNNRFSPTGLLMTDPERAELNKLLRRHSGSIALR